MVFGVCTQYIFDGIILETLAGDIREADTLTSKCRSSDVNIVTHCLNAGILYARESFFGVCTQYILETVAGEVEKTEKLMSKCWS